jgi:hypothetical protein
MPRRPAAGVLVAAVLIGLGAAVLFLPFMAKDRERIAVTPTPPAADTVVLVPLRGGQSACLDAVSIDPRSLEARFRVTGYGRQGPPVRLTLAGTGYRASARLAGGYLQGEVRLPIAAPPRALLVRACFTDEGRGRRARVGLFGHTEERSRSRPTVRVDGRPIATDVGLAFYEHGRSSLASHLPVVFERAAAFRPGWLGKVELWVLGVLVLAGLPLAALWAWSRALAAGDEPDGPAQPPAERSQDANASPPMSGTATRGTA